MAAPPVVPGALMGTDGIDPRLHLTTTQEEQVLSHGDNFDRKSSSVCTADRIQVTRTLSRSRYTCTGRNESVTVRTATLAQSRMPHGLCSGRG